MKSMILVLSPKECMNLLNGDLSVLIRNKFPKNYVGWVYIYCTKDKNKNDKILSMREGYCIELNSSVVARFWCDKVEEIVYSEEDCEWKTKSLCFEELLNKSLTHNYLLEYLGDNGGYAIHITKLEIFDKPKEISEFYKVGYYKAAEEVYEDNLDAGYDKNRAWKKAERSIYNDFVLTHAPTNYCYVEVE